MRTPTIRRFGYDFAIPLLTSSAVFHQPTAAFCAYMRALAGARIVYDVGAGAGVTTVALRRAGVAVVPLDVAGHESARCTVARGDGGAWPYEPGSIVLLARPCHGGFVDEVVVRAREQGVHAVVYVSKASNVAVDIAHHDGFVKELEAAGRDDEELHVLRLTEVAGELAEYVLVQYPGEPRQSWLRTAGDRWYNKVGGWMRAGTFPVLGRTTATGWAELPAPEAVKGSDHE